VNSVHTPAFDVAALEARFAVAARHSRLVRILRVAVPAVVAASMAVIFAIAIFNPFRDWKVNLPSFNPAAVVVSGTSITMETPHLAGYTPDQRPYELWAKTATQDIRDPDRVELRALKAKLLMQDQSTLFLDSRGGTFDNKQQQLDLRDNVVLRTSTGYEAHLNQAFVDMNKNTVTSDEHVDVKLTNGTLSSDRLRITDGGEVIRFEGNVVMHLDKLGDQPGAAAQAPAEPAASAKPRTNQNKSANSK